MTRRLSGEKRSYLDSILRNGTSPKRAAELLEVSLPTLRKYVKASGLRITRFWKLEKVGAAPGGDPTITREKVKEINDVFGETGPEKQGKTPYEMAELLGVSYPTFTNHVRRSGYRIKSYRKLVSL